MSNDWLRLWHDMPTDPKWRTIARASGQSISSVMAVYLHVLVCASNATERGRTQSLVCEDVASALDMNTEDVEHILEKMQGRVLDGDKVRGWEKRQPVRDDGSAERAKAWREAQKEAKRTQPNACERNRTLDTDTDTEEEKNKSIVAGATVGSADDKPKKSDRLTAVTEQAIGAFNAALSVKAGGLLSAVTMCTDKRKAQVRRTVKLAAMACERLYGSPTVTPEFWQQYFEEVQRDDFKSGRGPYVNGHANWRPDFEYLTRPEVVEKVIDDALSRVSP